MIRFMTLDFADGDRPQMLARVIGMARGAYGYVVTPNVDHVIKLMDGRVGREVYADADLKVCDSRILSHLARLRGVTLPVYPGSDMTADLLASSAAEGLTIAVFGPDRAAFNDLAARYPRQTLKYLEAPHADARHSGLAGRCRPCRRGRVGCAAGLRLLPQTGTVRPRPAG